jgi:hypothetical protein
VSGPADPRLRTPLPTVRWHPLALVPVVLSAWVYRPLLHVFFYADDFYHLAQIADGRGMTFVVTPFAGHNLVARNLVFMGMWKLFGVHAESWYATVLATHLLNVWLLFGVLGALTGSVTLACFGAALWGTCPLAVGTIGWYSVYGQALVATILLLVLDRVTRTREPGGVAWAWSALLLVGSTCFGTGVAVAIAFPVVLFLLVPAAWARAQVRTACLALPAATMALYFGCRRIAGWLEPLPLRETIHEVAALHALPVAPAMLASLLGTGVAGAVLGPFADGFGHSAALIGPTVVVFCLGLGLVAWRGDGRARRVLIAMAVLAVTVYALIAVGRAAAYAMFNADVVEAAKAPRYHYVGTLPITVLFSLILRELSRVRGVSAVPGWLALGTGLGLLVAGYGGSHFRIDRHAATRAYFEREAAELEQAVRAAPPDGTVQLANGSLPAGLFGPLLDVFFPGRAAIFLLISPSDELAGRRVRFVEHDARILDYWREHSAGRMATLLDVRE